MPSTVVTLGGRRLAQTALRSASRRLPLATTSRFNHSPRPNSPTIDHPTTTTSSSSSSSSSPSTTRCLSTSAPRSHMPSGGSIDPEEISHFNALASTWWNPHGPSRLLHLMNPIRVDFIRGCLQHRAGGSRRFGEEGEEEQGLTYLDVGCGGGIFAEAAARLPGTRAVTGIDPSSDVLSVAMAHARKDPSLKGRLEYVNASVDQLVDYSFPENAVNNNNNNPNLENWKGQGKREPPQQYDVVTIFEVVEHVPYPAPFLRNCMSLVKPGGWLIGSTISRTWTSWLTTIVAAENLLGIVPPGTHDWSRYINSGEMVDFFEGEEGWGNIERGGYVKIMGVVYVPGLGWKKVGGAEEFGNYFFAARKEADE